MILIMPFGKERDDILLFRKGTSKKKKKKKRDKANPHLSTKQE
jgi:hypothetical protein